MSMKACVRTSLFVIGVILALPLAALAQEASIGGTVTDSTGGVLPGVTITALHQATGNTFVAVTDENGAYRIPVRIGGYRITADLPGFASVARALELVVGQQVTNVLTGGGDFGQPRYSRDAIAEFEFVANRFDATQGRSMGVQVNAVTKSGTNTRAGTFAGYFRNDKFNAADFIQHRVIPYSDQQLSMTYGGPILKDRLHYFVNYEYEREPQTYTYSSPYPAFNIDQSGTRRENKGGGRLDFQSSPQTHLSVRVNLWGNLQPYDSRYAGGATRHPSGALVTDRRMRQVFTDLSHVVS